MKSKKAAVLIAVIFVYAAVLAGFIYIQKTGRAFIIFGILIKEFSSLYSLLAVAFAVTVAWVFRKNNPPKFKAVILSCIAVLLGLFPVIYDVGSYHGKRITAEILTLPDGEKVLLDEVHYSEESAEIFVYKIGGCIAKETGSLFEGYFGSGFYGMEQGCWEYTYDEAEKKLKIIIEYDELSPFIKEEYDTGFWEEEFILE